MHPRRNELRQDELARATPSEGHPSGARAPLVNVLLHRRPPRNQANQAGVPEKAITISLDTVLSAY